MALASLSPCFLGETAYQMSGILGLIPEILLRSNVAFGKSLTHLEFHFSY